MSYIRGYVEVEETARRQSRHESRRIVFVTYKGVWLLDLSGPLEAFRVAAAFARPQERNTTYECIVVSVRGGRVKTADGVELNTKSVRSIADKSIDTVIAPGAFLVDDVTRDQSLVQWIRKTAGSHSRSVSPRPDNECPHPGRVWKPRFDCQVTRVETCRVRAKDIESQLA
jgi:hypothetical protein